jgi:hypothetical protein
VIFLLEILDKNNDECILILVIYWKKTGLLRTKISNHNVIYSSYKPRKSSSLPLKSSSWLFSLDAFKLVNNTYPRCIKMQVEFRSHFSVKTNASYGPGNMVFIYFLLYVFYIFYMVLVNDTVNISNVMSPNGRTATGK